MAAFLRLPGRQLRYPEVGRVPLLPAPIVKPTIATAIAQALPGILKHFDPVEQAKEKAQLAYYSYLQSNPTGMKPMTEYQKQMLELAKRKTADAEQKGNNPFFYNYLNAMQGYTSPTVSPPRPPVIMTPRPQGDIGNSVLGGKGLAPGFLGGNLSSASVGTPVGSSGDLSSVDTSGLDTTEPTVDNSVDVEGLKNQIIAQNPGISDREAYQLALQQA